MEQNGVQIASNYLCSKCDNTSKLPTCFQGRETKRIIGGNHVVTFDMMSNDVRQMEFLYPYR